MPLHRFAFRAMASSHAIVLDGDDAGRVAGVAAAMIAEVGRIEAKYTRFRDTSLVALLVGHAPGCHGLLALPGRLALGRHGPHRQRRAQHQPGDQKDRERRRGRQGLLVPAGELAEPIPRARRTRLHRFIRQVALHVTSQAARRVVAP